MKRIRRIEGKVYDFKAVIYVEMDGEHWELNIARIFYRDYGFTTGPSYANVKVRVLKDKGSGTSEDPYKGFVVGGHIDDMEFG